MRPRLIVLACLLALGVSACGAGEPKPAAGAKPIPDTGLYAGATLERAGLRLPARVHGRGLELGFKGAFAERFWPGVNLGA